jgi:hypothetical protein
MRDACCALRVAVLPLFFSKRKDTVGRGEKPQAASRKPQAASRKSQVASRKPQAASRKPRT